MVFNSQITFLYYKNLEKAVEFYEKIFDFKLKIDQVWAKIYQVTGGAFIGLVDEKKGHFNWQKEKTVMITLVTKKANEVDNWYKELHKHNVKFLSEPRDIDEIGIRCFIFEDPEGYVIEIQYFYNGKN
ncbi:MAG: VOC family protein [Candidatus Heimdallarchaeota archaeon]|nr:VOC family protein [Candidatus Heimdallarchaeota archaeon]